MKKRRWLGSSAGATSAASPPPQTRITQNHSPTNWAGLLFTAVVCAVGLALFFWWALVRLIDLMGYHRPDRAAAWLVVWFIFGSIGLYIAGWIMSQIINWVALPVLKAVHDMRVDVATINNNTERVRYLAAANPAPDYHRLTDAEKSLRDLLLYVMRKAYGYVLDHGQYKPGMARPWSRDEVRRDYPGTKPPSQTLAGEVRKWLEAEGIIYEHARNQTYINLDDFPTFAHVQARVQESFTRGVVVRQSPHALPASALPSLGNNDTGRYQHIAES